MRHLLIMRHARAESGGSDAMRALAPQGRRDAVAAGRHIAQSGIVPDVVLVSAALRTRQTCERVLSGLREVLGDLSDDGPRVEFLDDLYGAGPRDVVALLQTVASREAESPSPDVVLVIGHEPTMSGVANWLADHERSEPAALAQVRVGMPTASLALLEINGDWAGLSTTRGYVAPEEDSGATTVVLADLWTHRA